MNGGQHITNDLKLPPFDKLRTNGLIQCFLSRFVDNIFHELNR